MRHRKAFSMVALFILFFIPSSYAFEVSGLSTPESFIVDPETGNYFISNINGQPTSKDDNGFITKLDPNGKVLSLRFADGSKGRPLHAPKGLTILDTTLYVTDIDHLKGYDKKSGILVMDLDFAKFKATFLNDLTHDTNGNLYVSDMVSNFIAKIDTNKRHEITVLIQGKKLGQPNGLAIHPTTKRIVMVSWQSGKVVELSNDGKLTPLSNKTFKNLDGVDFDTAGNLYFSSFTEGKVYKMAQDGQVNVFRDNLRTPADINIDPKKNLLLIPSFEGNSVKTIPLNK